MTCTHVLRNEGKPYPRTCSECGLGPCRYSFNDMAIASKASPALAALADVMKEAAPGLRIPHETLAATIDRMLRKRGFSVQPVDAP